MLTDLSNLAVGKGAMKKMHACGSNDVMCQNAMGTKVRHTYKFNMADDAAAEEHV